MPMDILRIIPKRMRPPINPTPIKARQMMQRSLGSLLFLLVYTLPVFAQDAGQTTMENQYARPGHPTMVIYVLGDVGITGRWRVEREAQLLDVLAVARPAAITTEDSQSLEDVRVKVYRGSDDGRALVFNEPIESLLTSSNASLRLEEGDVVVVDLIEKVNATNSFREVLQIVTGVASLVLTAIALATR